MSKRSQERHEQTMSCKGKQQHADAAAGLTMVHFAYCVGGDSLWPYECVHCGKWHVGHKPLNVRKMIHALLDTPLIERGSTPDFKIRLHEAMNSGAVR